MNNIAINRKFKEFHYKTADEIKEYLDMLFKYATGDYKWIVRSSSDYINITNLDRFKTIYSLSAADLEISIGRYKNKKDDLTHTTANLTQINLFCIDVDYEPDPNFIANLYMLTSIPEEWYDNFRMPVPNIIEFGHRARFIYILKEPIVLAKNKTKLIQAYNLLGKVYCKIINDKFPNWHAEPMQATKFIRIPGSINSKTGDIINYFCPTLGEEEHTFQELFVLADCDIVEEIVDASGNKEEWYDKFKERERVVGKTGKKNVRKMFNSFQLWTDRQAFLDEVQDQCEDNRELYLYIYALSLLWTEDIDPKNDMELLLKKLFFINSRFSQPLLEKEIKSKFRTIKKYPMKDETIEDYLGVTMTKQLRYAHRKREEQIAAGKAKFQEMERNRIAVHALSEKGLSQRKIAEQLKLGLGTVNRLLKRAEPYTAKGQLNHNPQQ